MSHYAVELKHTAKAMVAPGRGILAMDESNATCNKRFEKLAIPATEERRRTYRELILTTPGLGEFISGAIRSSEHLNAMNAYHKSQCPWPVTFSYARAIQQPALEHWRGNYGYSAEAQRLLLQRARLNSAASLGQYTPEMEKSLTTV